MQVPFQDTISFKLLHSEEKLGLVKTLIHKVLNGPSKMVHEQRGVTLESWALF